jgi:hypothetical protein
MSSRVRRPSLPSFHSGLDRGSAGSRRVASRRVASRRVAKLTRGVRRGVCRGVQDGSRSPALRGGTPEMAIRPFQGPAGSKRVGTGRPYWQALRYYRESKATPSHTPMQNSGLKSLHFGAKLVRSLKVLRCRLACRHVASY